MKPVATSSIKPIVKHSSSQQVKSKFFNMLGIESTPNATQRSLGGPIKQNQLSGVGVHPRDVGIVSFQEELKYDAKFDDILLYQRRKVSQSRQATSDRKKKKISFNNSVNVVPIPKRNEYSSRISCRMWSNAAEIHENAARNSLEFAAEG